MATQAWKLATLFHAGKSHRKSSRKRTTTYRRLLRFEQCEDRHMLAVFSVTDLNDGLVTDFGDQPGTLRQAIFDANETPGADRIEFDPSLNGATIELTQGELSITESVTIDGRDANGNLLGITIDADDGYRIFNISGGSSGQVEINGLRLTGGDTSHFNGGGAIFSSVGLMVKNSIITGNASSFDGGGIRATADLTVENSTINGNTANAYGGGIAFDSPSDHELNVVSSTISGNEAPEGGGGIYAKGDLASVHIRSSHVTGNMSLSTVDVDQETGGGIRSYANVLSIQSSEIQDNKSTGHGGGLFARVPIFGSAIAQDFRTVSGH